MSTIGRNAPRRAAARLLRMAGAAGLILGACAPRARVAAPAPIVVWPSAGPCSSAHEPVAAVDEPTPLGFAAIEAVQRLGGARTSRLVWLDPPRSPEYELTFGPERELSELTLSLALAPGEIVLRRTSVSEGADADACDEDALLIPVEVALESRERALAESFRAVLEASSPERGRLSVRFELPALHGGLTFTEPQSLDPRRSFQISAALLELLVWQGGSHGTVSLEIRAVARGDEVVAEPPAEQRPLVAVWPSAAPCPADWAALPPDATPTGASAADAVAELSAQPAETLRWSDGTAAELRLSFEALPDELCQSTRGMLEFDAALRAQSSDGRVDAVVPVRVVAEPEQGADGFHEIQLQRAIEGGAAPHVEIEAHYLRHGASGSLQLHAPDSAARGDGAMAPLASAAWSR